MSKTAGRIMGVACVKDAHMPGRQNRDQHGDPGFPRDGFTVHPGPDPDELEPDPGPQPYRHDMPGLVESFADHVGQANTGAKPVG